MPVTTGEARGVGEETLTSEQNFANYVAIHGLKRMVAHKHDIEYRSGVMSYVLDLRFPPYTAPEDEVIVVYPNHPKSREVPLSITVATTSGEWAIVGAQSDPYERAVHRDREFDVEFHAQSIEYDENGNVYAYNDDRTARASLNADTDFYKAPRAEVQ